MGHGADLVTSRDEQSRFAVTAPSWGRVKELLHQAVALGPEARARFLDEVCASDAPLRAELESLLSVGDELSAEFLQSGPMGTFGAYGGGPGVPGLAEGQLFEQRFRLIRRLGEGGMGQVWLAEQTAPVRRPVALKLIKAGMYDETVVQRFQAERQSLAIMDHPAIAKVFDAGITPQGQPYFVMEYVPGLPIAEYCDEKKLKIRERLELFIQACEGVQHAHQKAIIHRDLKPANILVVEVDGKPVPRIIDFGLSKATSPHLTDQTLYTRFGQFMGTPGYMSPEQVDPNIRDIDTRTDVYSLGVILYVLLTGLQPFESHRRQKPALDEWLRQLREEEPRRPSSKVSADWETSTATAAARGTESKQLVSELRGDLDWIAMKALERDRERRYGTPAELAADLRRYLHDEPIVARPASAWYRFGKYIRRHRIATSVAAGVLLLFGVFSVLQALQLEKTKHERDRATRITDFMTGMFKVSDPNEARGNSVTAREILDKSSKEMDQGLAQDPEVQSQMMQVMASTYVNLGLYSRAHELAQRALKLRMHLDGPEDPKTLESLSMIGWILGREGYLDEAEKLERQALAGERRVLGPADPLTLLTTGNLAYILDDRARYAEAEQLLRDTLRIERRVFGPENPRTLDSTSGLALVLDNQNRFVEAEALQRESFDVRQRVLGPDHPDTLASMSILARILNHEQRYAEAEKLYRAALEIERRVLGLEHPTVLGTLGNLADDIADAGRYADAEQLLREALRIKHRVLGPEHPDTLTTAYNLATVLDDEGRYVEAEDLQRETLNIQRRVLGPNHRDTLKSMYDLACYTARNGKRDEALSLLREAIDHGYNNQELMKTDSELQSLHSDPRFNELVALAGHRAATVP
jgi:eukaryotic-like serine/threonine-protein kinase